MTTLNTTTVRPPTSAHRARIVGDAVISAYIREISSFEPAPERPVVRALPQPAPVTAPGPVTEPPSVASRCATPRIRIRRWAPPERRGPALEAAA